MTYNMALNPDALQQASPASVHRLAPQLKFYNICSTYPRPPAPAPPSPKSVGGGGYVRPLEKRLSNTP